MIRDDGSVNSANNTSGGRFLAPDYGLYRGVVREVIYTDDDRNESSGPDASPKEVVYSVMLIGGLRDGQIFNNARLMKSLGGFSNYEQTILKETVGISNSDISDLTALADFSLNQKEKLSGDAVYIQFLNGDVHMPVIVGMAFHNANTNTEATESDGPIYQRNYNGIFVEINKDGEFTWSKDNGAFVPYLPNLEDPLQPFVDQFAPLPGQEKAIKFTLGNQYDLKLEFSPSGLNVSIDGITDEFQLNTATGTAITVTGLAEDTVKIDTALGTSLKVAGGASDSIELSTSIGASLKVDGLEDAINIATTGGASLDLTTAKGLEVASATGDAFNLGKGKAELKTAIGAQLVLDTTGFIKLGNASGDAMQLIGELLNSLAGATYAGYGAPGSNVVDLAQLVIKWKLISG